MSDETTSGVSRRDFLRRAGKKAAKEAVEVGGNLVPGVAALRLLQQQTQEPMESSEEALDPDATTEETTTPPVPKNTLLNISSPLSLLARWRIKRTQ